MIGTFISNRKGFGFVEVKGVEGDFFIPEKYTLNAFNGDIVRIEVLPHKRGKRKEARILKIESRSSYEVIGTFDKSSSFGFVIPDNPKLSKDIYITEGRSLNAKDRDKVLCVVEDFGNKRKGPSGYVSKIIGNGNEPFVDIKSIAASFGIEEDFPDEVIACVNNMSFEISGDEKDNRLDLTNDLIITIDGDDSKDLDDAISLTKVDGIYKLGVHIADVSHYVIDSSPLDKEALKRSTSVYLMDVVIPMLPKELSNGICSLNEKEERLTLSCIMEIDEKGVILSSKICTSFIKSAHRMTYGNVNKILSNRNCNEANEVKDVVPMLFLMEELAGILNKKRRKKGSIDLDIPEAKIKLDQNGFPIEIGANDRGVSERIIEEFMLAANETVARTCFEQGLPILYRTHPAPSEESVEELMNLSFLFGINIKPKKGTLSPKDIQTIIDKAKDTDNSTFISTVCLRSMQQARYTSDDPYHFGLAAEYYCHFTSPIRRYPDLFVHRVIKENLKKPLSVRQERRFLSVLEKNADITSKLERRAIECEREVEKLKKCQYMEIYIGKKYEGIISGVTGWGLYVTLDNTIEGMVPIQDIPGDYYIYNEKGYEIVGKSRKKSYKLGEKVTIIVEKVDIDSRTIDFRLEEDEKTRNKNNRTKQKGKA